MAAALLGIGGDKISVMGAECVSKSYPDFFEAMQSIGAKISGK